jgi:hypothetical protein
MQMLGKPHPSIRYFSERAQNRNACGSQPFITASSTFNPHPQCGRCMGENNRRRMYITRTSLILSVLIRTGRGKRQAYRCDIQSGLGCPDVARSSSPRYPPIRPFGCAQFKLSFAQGRLCTGRGFAGTTNRKVKIRTIPALCLCYILKLHKQFLQAA